MLRSDAVQRKAFKKVPSTVINTDNEIRERQHIMIRNSLIALTAAAAFGVALAPAAEAKTKIDFNVNLGLEGGYVQAGSPGYDDDDYVIFDDGCHYVKVKHKSWNKWHTKKVTYFTKELVCY